MRRITARSTCTPRPAATAPGLTSLRFSLKIQAQAAKDAEAAFEARKVEMQAVGEAEYFQGRIDYWREHGETLEAAVVQAWEETQRRNTTRADGRLMSTFIADCD